jgi:hypothetical protein
MELIYTKTMKYFLKLLVKSKKYYFVPGIVSTGVETDEGYIISASVRDDQYSFSILKERKYINGFTNNINPGQTIEIVDGDNVLLFSLTSHSHAVKRYLKSKPGTTVREMEEFYSYIGKENRIKKKRSSGPLQQTSGMDPDLRDEYARKGNI